MIHKSKPSSIKNLKRLFLHWPESDSISLDQAYGAFNRDLTKEQQNKNWITNLMTHLKWHSLILPTYGVNNGGKRVLKGLALTMEGKKSLGRIETSHSNFVNSTFEMNPLSVHSHTRNLFDTPKPMDISEIMTEIAKLREKHPEFEIIFDMKLKGV